MSNSGCLLLLLPVLALAGRAAGQALQTDASSAAIRSAEGLGVKGVSRASLHPQRAKEAAGSDDEGKSMLLRAEVDTELALALPRVAAEKESVEGRANNRRVDIVVEPTTTATK